jgi:hypothetical protein
VTGSGRRASRVLAVALAAASWPAAAAGQEPQPGGDKFPLPDAPPELGQVARSVSGSLAIRAVQGTPGGPRIGAVPVTVDLYHRGMLVDSVEAQLDEHGVTVLESLPAGMGVEPRVRVVYKGMTYLQDGPLMDAAHPQQTVEVVCYEPTEVAPDWAIGMWHVMMDRRPPGLFVTEVIVVENPADRTWLGSGAGEGDKPVTTSFALHERAQGVALGPGFHDWCCTTHAPGSLVNHLPLMPDRTEFKFSYVIPAQDDAVAFDIVAPAPADHVMVILPDDIEVRDIQGLTLSATDRGGPRPVVAYSAADLGRGQRARLGLAGLGAPAPLADGAGGLAKIAAAVGGGVLLVLAVVIVVARSGRGAAAESWPS